MGDGIVLLLQVVIGYIVGSVPSGYLIARMQGINDIRNHGSGATGATNVARVLGFKYFLIVFAIDFFKSYGYLQLLAWCGFGNIPLTCCAASLLIGNGYSLFLGSRNGKGVATLCGILWALAPLFLMALLGAWVGILLVSQTVGIASAVIYLCMPWYSYFFCDGLLFPFLIFASLWGLWLHRDNIMKYVYMVNGV
jgi:glycerol-3-phosphate acyltransferase PlsY